MKHLLILVSIVFLLLISSASAVLPTTCFQETANVAEDCGALSTGTYEIPGAVCTFTDGANLYDADYGTRGRSASGTCYLEINYTKPDKSSGADWRIKDDGATTDLSIPASCWDYSATHISLRAISDEDSPDFVEWVCKNATTRPLLRTYSTTRWIYEEGINWSLSSRAQTTLNNPLDSSGLLTTAYNFTATQNTTVDLTLQNATYYIWHNDGTLFNSTTVDLSGKDNMTSLEFTGFNRTITYKWNMLTTATNSSGAIFTDWADTNNTFNYGFDIINRTYNDPTYETTSELIELNIQLMPGSTLTSATLYYNNTAKSTGVFSTGDNKSIRSTIIAPGVTSSTEIPFYWTLVIDGDKINTTELNQTVNDIQIDNCTSNTIQVVNYTMYDEDDRTLLTGNTTIEIYVKLTGDLTGQEFSYFSGSLTQNPITICIAENLSADTNYLFEADVQYSADDRVSEYHIIRDKTITKGDIPLSYDLYDLLTTSSTEYLITYKDSDYIPVSGATIDIQRQYLDIGQFLTVERPLTDADGRTIGHLVSNDEVYNIIVRKNNEVLATFTNVRTFCASAVNDCRINLNEPSSSIDPDDFIDYLNVSYTTSYDDSSRTFEVIFSTTDGDTKTFELDVVLFDNYQNQTICTNTLSSSSGSLSCVIPTTYGNGTAIAKLYVDSGLLFTESFAMKSSYSDMLGNFRYLIAAAVIITLPLMAITSATMTVVFLLVGLILVGGLFLVDYGSWFGASTAFLWIVIATIIILFKVNRSENG